MRHVLIVTLLVCFALCPLSTAHAQQEAVNAPPLGGVIDDKTPGMVRLGDVQIAWGVATVPCPAPAQFCQVKVQFPLPFSEKPVVTLANLASHSTEKAATVSLYQELVTPRSFTARVSLEANVRALKQVPWTAIGRWR